MHECLTLCIDKSMLLAWKAGFFDVVLQCDHMPKNYIWTVEVWHAWNHSLCVSQDLSWILQKTIDKALVVDAC